MALQQYLVKPNSSIAFFLSSPFSVFSLYSSHKWPIGFPHEKHLIGIIILYSPSYLYDFCTLALAWPCLFGLAGSFLLTSATNKFLSYFKKVFFSFSLFVYSTKALAIASLEASAWLAMPPPKTFTSISTLLTTSPANNNGSLNLILDSLGV